MKQDNLLPALQELALRSVTAWRIDCAEIAVIKYRENAVFKIVAADGQRFALRLHRSGYHSAAELQSELQWMSALQADGIDVPLVIPTVEGELFVKAMLAANGEVVLIDLFEWIDGVQVGSAENGLGDNVGNIDHTYRTIGSIAARLHNHAQTWQLPDGFARHAWDVEGLVGEQPFWGRFWELDDLTEEQRSLMRQARAIVKVELQAMASSPVHAGAYGLIHADFVPDNLMVSNGTVRLLDFDDAGFGWHLFEIATALYFIQDDPNYAVARAALIAGYRQHRALSDDALEQLPVLMMARAFTYLGWVHTRRHNEAAREITPLVIDLACTFAASFVASYKPERAG